MASTYRSQFAGKRRAADYERLQYDPESYASILWEIEQQQLAGLVGELRKTHRRISYLDFAAGTGRVLSFLEPLVDTAVGIEISPDMLEIASRKVRAAKLLCCDITTRAAEPGEKYDLITAFRFFLNAEPALRVQALKALAARLRDPSSLLVFNNHGNPWSHKLILWPYHKARRWRGERRDGNYMSFWEARRYAEAAGLVIECTMGCGVLGGKLAALMSYERALDYERAFSARAALWPVCVNQMYVARLKK